MGVRGPKSANQLSVVARFERKRPEPPAELPQAAAGIWRSVVAALPPEWFGLEQHGLLAAYCEHAVAARRLHDLVTTFADEWLLEDAGLARFDKLLQLRARETAAMGMLATRMRLTPQSRYTPQRAATASRQPTASGAPWQFIA
jgi:hypothetical protein